MTDFSTSEINGLFSEAMTRGGDALNKTAEVLGTYIQKRTRENAFCRSILNAQVVTMADLTRNTEDEGFHFIDDLEPDSAAMQVNMRSEPTREYIEGRRYRITFSTISSKEFRKSEEELRTYRMPITRILEQNIVKDIQEVEDRIFMDHVRVALVLATRRRMNLLVDRGAVLHEGDDLGGTGGKNFATRFALASYLYTRKVANLAQGGAIAAGNTSPATHAWGSGFDENNANFNPADGQFSNLLMLNKNYFDRTTLRDLVKIQAAREMKARMFLLHEFTYADVLGWLDSDAGLELTSEIVRDGYKYSTIGGMTFVTTIRDNPDIVRPGQIFTFPPPEFLGRHLVLEGTKFFINKQGRFLSMEAWQTAGMGFGNVMGVGCGLLAGASIQLPNIWQNSAGTVLTGGNVGTFEMYNNPSNPFAAP